MPEYSGVRYGGCLVKVGNLGIRILNEEKQVQVTKPYQTMSKLFEKVWETNHNEYQF